MIFRVTLSFEIHIAKQVIPAYNKLNIRLKERITMKRLTALLLLFSLLLSACSNNAPAEATPMETVPETTAEPTTEPTAEPTLSPEELFIQSLPEKLRQAL